MELSRKIGEITMSKFNYKTEINAVGREVIVEINGEHHVPFQGVGKYKPTGRKAAPPHPLMQRLSRQR